MYDEDDLRGHKSYLIVETVKGNTTKRQVASANLAHNLQAGLVYPSVDDLRWIVKANLLKDNPVANQDVDVAQWLRFR